MYRGREGRLSEALSRGKMGGQATFATSGPGQGGGKSRVCPTYLAQSRCGGESTKKDYAYAACAANFRASRVQVGCRARMAKWSW